MSSTNHTTNYDLPQWVSSDPFRREDFNEAFQKIDTAINGAGIKIEAGSYTGTAAYGTATPRTLSFNFQPKIVFLIGWNHDNPSSHSPIATFLVNGFGAAPILEGILGAGGDSNAIHTGLTVTFSGNNISFYGTHSYNNFNYSGVTYHFIAIG